MGCLGSEAGARSVASRNPPVSIVPDYLVKERVISAAEAPRARRRTAEYPANGSSFFAHYTRSIVCT